MIKVKETESQEADEMKQKVDYTAAMMRVKRTDL